MDMRIPPLKIQILLESNPPKSSIFVGRLGVACGLAAGGRRGPLSGGRASARSPAVVAHGAAVVAERPS